MFFPFIRKRQDKKGRKFKVSSKSQGTKALSDYEHAVELSPDLKPEFTIKLLLDRTDTGNHTKTSAPIKDKESVKSFKLEQNNEFIYGAAAGMIAAAVKYAFNELMQVMNIAKFDNNATSITVVMESYRASPVFWVFGFIVSLFIGAFFGLIIAFMFSYIFNDKYYLLKGAGIGVGIWLFNFGVMSRVFNYPELIANSLGDIVSMLLSLIIFGMVTVYSLKKMGFIKG